MVCFYVFVLNLLQVIQRGWWQLFCRWTRPPTSSSPWLLPSWRAARPWPSTSQIRWGRWGEDSLVQDWWRIWPLFWIYIFKTEPKCIEKKDFVMSSHHKTKILNPPWHWQWPWQREQGHQARWRTASASLLDMVKEVAKLFSDLNM